MSVAEVKNLRNDLLKLLRVGGFTQKAEFSNPCTHGNVNAHSKIRAMVRRVPGLTGLGDL